MDIYSAWGAIIQPVGAGSATTISGISSQGIALGTEHGAEPAAGQTRAQHSEITSITPRGSFSTFDLKSIIDLIGTEGACLQGGAVAGFELYQLKLEQCGDVAAGSVHRKIILPNGRIIPRSISCSHRSNAEISVEVMSTYDGTNLPVIPVDAVAAPTGLDDAYRYTLGEVVVGGVAIEGNTSVDINFGVDVQADGGDSDLYDTHLQVLQVKPEISITTRDVSKFKTAAGIPMTGVHALHADSYVILRRRVNGTGEFSENPDSIKITFDGLVAIDSATSASGNQRADMTIKVTCLDDGTNAPLLVDTAFDLVV